MYPLKILLLSIVFVGCNQPTKVDEPVARAEALPNIIIIYADDLGFGDVGAYGNTAFATPNIDFLAKNGRMFTDAHAPSATCTPSRYGLLTGEYPWRNKGAKILPGSAPLIIETSQETLASMLKGKGYRTGIIGKWHLGLGSGIVNWNQKITPGPNELGFDYSHILAATQDRVPTVYIQNGGVVNLEPDDPIEVRYENNFPGEPTGLDNPELLSMKWHHGHNNSIVNGIGRIGFMKGGERARWSDEDMADHFLVEVKQFVESKDERPFFLYYALQQPHVPRTPHPRFVGKSGLGPRGDVIVEADYCVGQLVDLLESLGQMEDTLIIFSSDNGPVLNDGYYDEAVERNGGHTPWGLYRGGKYSLYEAGTRVPFITYWKGRIPPGKSSALISQLDIFSSLAQLTSSNHRGRDSEPLLSVLLGNSEEGRKDLVVEAVGRTALRSEQWKLIPPHSGASMISNVNIESGAETLFQLYDLNSDPGEKRNLADSLPEKLKELETQYNAARF